MKFAVVCLILILGLKGDKFSLKFIDVDKNETVETESVLTVTNLEQEDYEWDSLDL